MIRFHALQKKKVIPGGQKKQSNKVQRNIVFFPTAARETKRREILCFPDGWEISTRSLFCWCFCKPPGLIKINHGGYAQAVGVNILIPGYIDKPSRKSWSKVKTSRAYSGEKLDSTNRKKRRAPNISVAPFFFFALSFFKNKRVKIKKTSLH